MNSILVAVNDSVSSRGMISYFNALPIIPNQVHITLLHILRQPYASEELMGENFIKSQPARMLMVLEQAKEKLVEQGFNPDQIEIKLVTDPYPTVADGIIDIFRKGNYNMVVIGRKRMSKAEEFVLGDISIKLVRALEGAAIMIVKL
jgi:nucleotide-binding universal stress UspA family protein